jgi:membrane protease YdiL (CAAX protease family)
MTALLRRRPVISYVVIAFAWTWTYVILFLIVFPIPDNPVRTTPGDLGPTIAAVVMSAVVAGRAGVVRLLKALVRWRVGVVWYAFALLGLPLIYTVSIALVPGAVASYKPMSLTDVALLPVLYVFLAVTGGPLTEEPGWRGFALPRLQQRWGPLAGTAIVGLMWTAWHLPNYFRPDWAAVNGGFSFSGVAVFATVAVSFSMVITWVYNRTAGSLLMAVLLHASLNFSQGLTGVLFPAARSNEVAPVAMLVILALVVIVATRGRLGYTEAETATAAAPAYSTP